MKMEYTDKVAIDDLTNSDNVDDEVVKVNDYFENLTFALLILTEDKGAERCFLYFFGYIVCCWVQWLTRLKSNCVTR